jgi:Phosphotransferase enzyme family
VAEEVLPGGFVNEVVRSGDTVRRPQPPDPAFVHALLRLFERRGWAGAPRFLGTDEQGREVLGFLDGHVAWQAAQPAEVSSAGSLARLAELVREFHDLTAGTELAAGGEVVCHNDLSPKNTVYRDSGAGLRPVAFIDWDIAAPGARIHDIAHVCWQYLDLGPDIADPAEGGQQIRVICDAYGLAGRDRLIDTILWWQDRCWRGIVARAAAGDPAMARLRDTGAVTEIRAAHAWVTRHRAILTAKLR